MVECASNVSHVPRRPPVLSRAAPRYRRSPLFLFAFQSSELGHIGTFFFGLCHFEDILHHHHRSRMIRLLFYDAAGNFSLAEFPDRNTPPYAILSHTWSSNEEDECTKKDIEEGTWVGKAGSVKLQFSMKQASTDGLKYVWIDTCCINRESSAELSEAINSMFKWYQSAARCYVYLSDLSSTRQRSFQTQGCCHSDELHHLKKWRTALQSSRWFTRGWTLQELLAPKTVVFFSRDGTCLGHKQELLEEIHQITGIPTEALRGGGRSLGNFSVGDRLRWGHNLSLIHI